MNVKRNLTIFISIFIFLSISFLPVLTGYFVFNDDAFMWVMEDDCKSHPQFFYFFYIGRVSFPFLACPLWSFTDTVGDLNVGRWINVFSFSLSAMMFLKWLQKYGVSPMHSFLLTLTAFIMPTFQTQIVLVNSFPHSVALASSILSAQTACKAAELISDKWKSIINRQTFISLALLFFSMTIYTPLSMFYWTMLSIPIIKLSQWDRMEKRKWFFYSPFLCLLH